MTQAQTARLDWKSGGWLIALTLVAILGVVAWRVSAWSASAAGGAIGDGRSPDSYGFDLTHWDTRLPRAGLAATGQPKDGLTALVDPPSFSPEALLLFNQEHRGKYVVGDDVVVGVQLGSVARAYPLRLLNWHEVVNDTLNDEPIAVTYSPLGDSVAVYRRRLDDDVLTFGISGLLFNSTTLLYDRRPAPGEESLWNQFLGRAISGPQAGRQLELLPCEVVTWSDWLGRHPKTSLVRPEENRLKRYQRNPYGSYLLAAKLRFPVDYSAALAPPPPGDTPMESVAVIGRGAARRDIALESAGGQQVEAGDGTVYRLEVGDSPERLTARIEPRGALRYARRFVVLSHPE